MVRVGSQRFASLVYLRAQSGQVFGNRRGGYVQLPAIVLHDTAIVPQLKRDSAIEVVPHLREGLPWRDDGYSRLMTALPVRHLSRSVTRWSVRSHLA